MKKIILIFLLFYSYFAIAQDIERIVDKTKKWNILFGSYPPEGGNSYHTRSYSIGEDTLIDNITYSKIKEDNIFCSEWIREDELHNVFYKTSWSEEKLIYTFNLNIGDEIVLKNKWDDMDYLWTVENIETIFFADKERKRITLMICDGCQREYWVEGIGSLYGLPYSGSFLPDLSTDLLCYYENEVMKYSNTEWNNCYVSLTIDETTQEMKIFPNPTKGELKIETNEQIEKITVFDIIGNIILTSKSTENDLSELPNGIYFLKIYTKNGVYTEKIIIEK